MQSVLSIFLLVDSPLSRWDARWKLAALTLAALSAATFHSLAATLVGFVASSSLAIVARLPWRWYMARISTVLPFLLVFALFLIYLDQNGTIPHHGTRAALLLCFKALTILNLMLVLLATTPMQVLFQASHSLHVPGLLVHLGLLTYRYVFLLANELSRLRIALRVRGYRNRATLHSYRTIGHVAGALLVRSHGRAERVGQAMRCRGFDGRFRSLAEFHTTGTDLLFFLLVIGAVLGLLCWDWFQRSLAV